MTIEIINAMTVLTPSSGKYLTNGEAYSERVYLGIHDSTDNWWETDSIPEETANIYTEDQLSAMTNDELKAILAQLGISTTMTKANMVKLILSMQND